MTGRSFKEKLAAVWAFIKKVAKRVWEYLKIAKMEWIVLASVFAFDLISKAIVFANLGEGESVTFIPYVFNIHRLSNFAAVFGSNAIKNWLGGPGARIFFCVFAVAASVAFVLVLIKHKGGSRFFRVGIALFIAGAMGNCIDRMFLGYVRDFIEFVYFGLTISGSTTWKYIFNVADIALIAGVIMIVIHLLFFYKDGKKKNEQMLTDALDENEPVDVNAQKTAADSADGTVEDAVARPDDSADTEAPSADKGTEAEALSADKGVEAEISPQNGVAEDSSDGGDS